MWFIRGPDLKHSRTSEAGIAAFYSEFHDKRLVAVIGGTIESGSEGGLSGLTVELLDFNHDHLVWFAGLYQKRDITFDNIIIPSDNGHLISE